MNYFYLENGEKVLLNIDVGTKWNSLNIKNQQLNSIFSNIDDGDGEVSKDELPILEKIFDAVDGIINKVKNNVLDNDELNEYMRQIKAGERIFPLPKRELRMAESVTHGGLTMQDYRDMKNNTKSEAEIDQEHINKIREYLDKYHHYNERFPSDRYEIEITYNGKYYISYAYEIESGEVADTKLVKMSERDYPIDEKILERAKQFRYIPERGDEQFTEEDCIDLALLSDEDLERAKKLFFVESRNKQFSGLDIAMLVTDGGGKFKVKDENRQNIDNFLTLTDSSNEELDSDGILRLMSLSGEQLDTAKQMLALQNRSDAPLEVSDIINILNTESQELQDEVMTNPQLGNFAKTKSASNWWLSATDKQNNVTLRYIQGQKYPEEITEENFDDNTVKRTLYNKNLNIRQILIFNKNKSENPIRIETQHLLENGEVEYTEVAEQGINPGTPDIYTVDAQGRKTYLQQTIQDKQSGIQRITKNFTDDKGNLTNFSYSIINENEYSLDYLVKDKDGNEIFKRHQELKMISDNVYEYKKDGKTYILETKDDKIIITDKSNNISHTFNYSDYVDTNNFEMYKENILKIPTDILIFITKKPLKLSYGTAYDVNVNQGKCRNDKKAIDIGTITKTGSKKELNDAFITILLHELGHYIDNPDLSKENENILSMSEDFIKIYKEELDDFNAHHTSEEQLIIEQFNGIGFQSKSTATQTKRSASEVFAESNMITNTNSKSWTSLRSYYLQRYFPRTIAKAQELLNARING